MWTNHTLGHTCHHPCGHTCSHTFRVTLLGKQLGSRLEAGSHACAPPPPQVWDVGGKDSYVQDHIIDGRLMMPVSQA